MDYRSSGTVLIIPINIETARTDTEIPVPADPMPAICDYFVNSIFSATLGVIANYHTVRCVWCRVLSALQAHCDKHGPCDPVAIQLAALHSKAVDAPKTGNIVHVPQYIVNLNGNKWPHYFEKSFDQSYHSTGVLVPAVLCICNVTML